MKRLLTVLVLPLLAACPTVEGLTRLDEFEPEAFEHYVQRAAQDVSLLAQVAVAEGDLTQEQVDTAAAALRSLTEGSALKGLIAGIELDSYSDLGLVLALQGLEQRLEARGAYEDGGLLSPRARELMAAIADALVPPG